MSQVNVSDTTVSASDEPVVLGESEVFHLDANDVGEAGEVNEATLTKAFDALSMQSGFKRPNMTNRMRRQIQQMRAQPQLQQQEQQRKLEEWKKKPNKDRVTFDEIKAAGAALGLNLQNTLPARMIRGAMRHAGYYLGVV